MCEKFHCRAEPWEYLTVSLSHTQTQVSPAISATCREGEKKGFSQTLHLRPAVLLGVSLEKKLQTKPHFLFRIAEKTSYMFVRSDSEADKLSVKNSKHKESLIKSG